MEYKSGKPKYTTADEAQLCAQILCLEEMLGINIEIEYLYYGKTERRIPIEISRNLREEVAHTAHRIHQMLQEEQLAPPIKKTPLSILLLEGGMSVWFFSKTQSRSKLDQQSFRSGGELTMRRLFNTLYITTQEAYLARERETIAIYIGDEKRRFPFHNLDGTICFGNIRLSPFLVGAYGEKGIIISYLSEYGKFLGRFSGAVSLC